jgi:hypothetical protein
MIRICDVAIFPSEVFLVLKLRGYFDESGIDEGSPYCVVAGYVSGKRQWGKFELKWGAVLKEYGVTEFHAKHFFGRDSDGRRVGEYRDWNDSKADRYLDQLTCIIEESENVIPLSCTVERSAWNQASYGERRFITGAAFRWSHKFVTPGAESKPYFVGFQICVTNAERYCPDRAKIHFVFDLNEQYVGYGQCVYEQLRDTLGDKLGPVTFMESHEAIPIQAADLLAYMTYKHCAKYESPAIEPSSPLRRLMANAKCGEDFPFVNELGIQLLSDGLPTPLRELKKIEQAPRVRRSYDKPGKVRRDDEKGSVCV